MVKVLSGTTKDEEREAALKWFNDYTDESRNELRILANVSVLKEGIDAPACDAVFFCDDK